MSLLDNKARLSWMRVEYNKAAMFGIATPDGNILLHLCVAAAFILSILASVTAIWDRLRNKKTFVTVEALAEAEARFASQMLAQQVAAKEAEARTVAYIAAVESRLTHALESFATSRNEHDAALQAQLLAMSESLNKGMQNIAGQIGELKGSGKTLEVFASAIAQNMGGRKG